VTAGHPRKQSALLSGASELTHAAAMHLRVARAHGQQCGTSHAHAISCDSAAVAAQRQATVTFRLTHSIAVARLMTDESLGMLKTASGRPATGRASRPRSPAAVKRRLCRQQRVALSTRSRRLRPSRVARMRARRSGLLHSKDDGAITLQRWGGESVQGATQPTTDAQSRRRRLHVRTEISARGGAQPIRPITQRSAAQLHSVAVATSRSFTPAHSGILPDPVRQRGAALHTHHTHTHSAHTHSAALSIVPLSLSSPKPFSVDRLHPAARLPMLRLRLPPPPPAAPRWPPAHPAPACHPAPAAPAWPPRAPRPQRPAPRPQRPAPRP